MHQDSPDSGLGSGGKLASELRAKVDIGCNPPLSKRDDLRVAALENCASQKLLR